MIKYLALGGILGLVFTVSAFDAAWAQNINQVSDNLAGQGIGVIRVLHAVAFVLGIGIAIGGLLKLKGYVDAPDQTPIQIPIAMLGVAGLLMSVPWVMRTSQETVGLQYYGADQGRERVETDLCKKRRAVGEGVVAKPGGASETSCVQ